MKKPTVGDTIRHTEHAFNRETEGTVIRILSAQFVYLPKGGDINKFCMFTEDWTFIKHKRPKLKRPR